MKKKLMPIILSKISDNSGVYKNFGITKLSALDSHRWPNLCLMKLSAHHKAQDDSVEWWRPEGRYDLVYKSRVFTDTYSKDTITVTNADEVICGGTGYGPGPNLPDAVEHTRPDYTLSGIFVKKNTAARK